MKQDLLRAPERDGAAYRDTVLITALKLETWSSLRRISQYPTRGALFSPLFHHFFGPFLRGPVGSPRVTRPRTASPLS